MSDDEKLSRPSFEPMAAGVSIGSEEFVFRPTPTIGSKSKRSNSRPYHEQGEEGMRRSDPNESCIN